MTEEPTSTDSDEKLADDETTTSIVSDDEAATGDGDTEPGDSSGDANPPALEGERAADRPLSAVAQRVADARPLGETDPDLDGLFDREDVDKLDSDQLWAELERGPEATDVLPEDDEREYRTIPKHQYCHQCEHFAEPPAVACTNEGTDIVEVPSLEAFRVVDCPVVLEDEALERDR